MNSLKVSLLFVIIHTLGQHNQFVHAHLNISSSRNITTDVIIGKAKCSNYYGSSVDGYHAPNQRTIPNKSNNKTNSNISTTLGCSKSQLVYRFINESEFLINRNSNGDLKLPSSNKTLRSGTYCIENIIRAQYLTKSNASKNFTVHSDINDPPTIIKIAICNIPNKHKKHQLDNRRMEANQTKVPIIASLKKCCPPGSRLTRSNKSRQDDFQCVTFPNPTEWQPAIFNTPYESFSIHQHLYEMSANVNVTFGLPHCKGIPHSLVNSKDIWFMALKEGTVKIGLSFWFEPVWLPPKNNEYCLDEFLDSQHLSNNNAIINSHGIYHRNQILLYCNIHRFREYLLHRRILGWMCIGAASIMFVLLIIYASIWELQNLSGWTQFNIFVALFLVNFTEGLRQIINVNSLNVETTTSCVIEAAAAQYFYLSLSASWIVMSFDLFYMFWNLEGNPKTVAWNKNRLIGYLLFSWLLPFFVSCISFYFAHRKAVKDAERMAGLYAFAHERCCSPIRHLGFQIQGIMFMLNIIFFFFTTFLIWKHKRGLNKARKMSRNMERTWRSVFLVLKLVIVMGVASLSIPIDYFFFSKTPLSTVAICFRMLHFFPFFPSLFIFGFSEKNVALINKKYPKFGKYFGKLACKSSVTVSGTPDPSRDLVTIK